MGILGFYNVRLTCLHQESAKDLIETALRVLDSWSDHHEPESADTAILQEAFPVWADLPEDELACLVIHSLCETAFSETARAAKLSRSNVV
jgi:hypothetical protein